MQDFISAPNWLDHPWGPTSLIVNGFEGFHPLILKQPGCEVEHHPHLAPMVRVCGAVPLVCLLAMGRNNFTCINNNDLLPSRQHKKFLCYRCHC